LCIESELEIIKEGYCTNWVFHLNIYLKYCFMQNATMKLLYIFNYEFNYSGTPKLCQLDNLQELLQICDKYNIWLHLTGLELIFTVI